MTTIEHTHKRAEADAKTFGYNLINNPEILQGLLEGLRTNEERYGYPSCPCRLATGNLELDRDIICPCDYRDPDITEYGACYCRLYINKDIDQNTTELPIVPERRPVEKQVKAFQAASRPVTPSAKEELVEISVGSKKMWYCKQCGYVVFRDDPPYICPICKAKKEMFAEIKTNANFYG